MNKNLLAWMLTGLLAGQAFAATNPSSVVVKVLETRLSLNQNCSNSVPVFSHPGTGSPFDLAQNPTLGSGSAAQGDYKCVLIHLSDLTTFTPAANDGSCVTGTSYTRDLFISGMNSTAPDGTNIPGRGTDPVLGPVEDFPWIYLAIGGTAHGNCFDPNSRCQLDMVQSVSNDKTMTFVLNFDGKVNGSGPSCWLDAPVLSIR